ncbi:glycoside hydrolase family 16 protein [Sistotremastrum niveocremeum HHB9708]|uniref:Glycoside hydrolase family 16 protein n=1 Tax=Sistotremastrum niveocremeum HHB9708 TaxID=1314777 RepID=A0A164W7E1_9AGAM|nr:glycoside hydrolase family 16 protein [Sistotremastrum niveocremeum HHB9708]
MFTSTSPCLVLAALPLLASALTSGFGSSAAVVRRHVEIAQRRATYTLEDKFAGESFFNGWSYWDFGDPTHGQVNYLAQDEAVKANLTYIDGNGAAVIAVDDYTPLGPGQPRNSVRISTNKVYNQGLFIMDVVKMPHGCSVWPAWWTVGPNWPNGGEIDIVEGVHEQATNQMTLHTGSGCSTDTTPSAPTTPAFTSRLLGTTCASSNANNDGCAFSDNNPNSYGHNLNSINGGVFAMLWDNTGIKIWHFARGAIPGDISSFHPQPTSWGSPAAFWATSSCSSSHFNNHQMVIDTTLCGDWAGASYGSAGCPGTCAEAVQNPANFKYAKWVINYIATYNIS